MSTKIQVQVKYKAKHYWKELRAPVEKGGKRAQKFAKRQLLCGQGARRLEGELVEHGDIIEIDDLSELGSAIDKFTVLNPQDVPKKGEVAKKEKMTRKKKGLKKVKREDGKWDVINQASGLRINDEPLTKKEATSIVDDSKRDD